MTTPDHTEPTGNSPYLTDAETGLTTGGDFLPLIKLSREVRDQASSLASTEARGLVELYYRLQGDRIDLGSQVRALESQGRPHDTATHFATQMHVLEKQMVSVLDVYSVSQVVGEWSRSIYGVGPVLAAALLAHIDIEKAPTVGHIWRFVGYDPTVRWGKGQKRPWNAKLKTACWKIGDSFVKFSGREECFYGQIYVERKEYEVKRNEGGGNAETAIQRLKTQQIKAADLKATLEQGRLPAGQLDLRARRYAVKLFLSHWHHVAFEAMYGEPPPKPYILTQEGGHAHFIAPPSWPM